MAAPRTARERARAEITAEILTAARRHLARDGAAGLSLRAVARDVGMVSSAVYRYVPNRDALLTMLIIEAYDGVGEAVEAAEAAVRRADTRGRFLAVCRAVRTWAVAHPHEYALIYGSPVPGYAAPEDTIAPATRVSLVLVGILVDLQQHGKAPEPLPVSRAAHRSLAPVMGLLGGAVSEDLMLRGLATWAALLGTVSLELFGHLHNVVAEDEDARAAYFDAQMSRLATDLGA
jgi:AcrR family transcriptional regulator